VLTGWALTSWVRKQQSAMAVGGRGGLKPICKKWPNPWVWPLLPWLWHWIYLIATKLQTWQWFWIIITALHKSRHRPVIYTGTDVASMQPSVAIVPDTASSLTSSFPSPSAHGDIGRRR
jgi:hypothetical protein